MRHEDEEEKEEKNKQVTKRSEEIIKLTQGKVSMNSNRVCIANYMAKFQSFIRSSASLEKAISME